MNRSRRLYSLLRITLFTLIIPLLSAVGVYAASSVRISKPTNNSTVPMGAVSVWTSFDQPSSASASVIAQEYTPVTFRIYKGGELQLEQSVYPGNLNFTAEGGYCTSFNFSAEGTYTIKASVPRTSNQWDSVTINVAKNSGGSSDSDSSDFSDESINSENAAVLSEGIPLHCRLTKANHFMSACKVTPSQSGYYIFFGAGSFKKVKGELYEGVGDTAVLDREESETGEEGCFCFMKYLNGGTTYTFLIQSTVETDDTIYDVGFISKSSGKRMASASELTLTAADGNYSIGVFSGSKIPDSEWVVSDRSVLDYNSNSNYSVGQPTYSGYFNDATVRLEPRKNGTAMVKLVDSNTNEVYAGFKVICLGFVETKESSQSGSNKTDSNTDSKTGTKTESKTDTDAKTAKKVTKLTASNKAFKAKTKTKKYTVTLKDTGKKAVKNVKLTLKVKGKTYTAKTNAKGKATFKITKLTKKGKYTAVIKFAGDENYKPVTKNVKITVKK